MAHARHQPSVVAPVAHDPDAPDTVNVCGEHLTIEQVVQVARHGARVQLSQDEEVLRRVSASYEYIANAVATGQRIYGVTTGFGGMAHVEITGEDTRALQHNLLWFLKAGAGKKMPIADIRAAMLLRANSLLRGASGVRLELIKRLATFLNAGVTPHVYEFGSIGASGDLVPLASITGALIGLDASFLVDFNGEEMDCLTALERLGLPRLHLQPKEGLALVNGTAVMTGIAANCIHDLRILLALVMGAHALAIQALSGRTQSFAPFIHTQKPHPGQMWAAATMSNLLAGSRLVWEQVSQEQSESSNRLFQDRYSLRCLPQYLGPIIDGMAHIAHQIETEINSATDNPLIDPGTQQTYHGGNFLGQYVGVAMDQLRYYVGLLAKHLDAQIALLVAPEFNNGLPPSLIGNTTRKVNMGLKGLQLAGNSIMPILTFFGNSLVDRFPTHAEQFNQNISSQGLGSARLARQAVDIFQQYMAIALMFGVQAVDLRTYAVAGHYDARAYLSPASARLYEAVRAVVGRPPAAQRPYIWNDDEQPLDVHIARLAADIAAAGRTAHAVTDIVRSLS